MPRCDFCGSRLVRWRYATGERDWLACEKCRAVIEADDRQGLLERVLLKPLPQTVPDRYAPRHEQKARGSCTSGSGRHGRVHRGRPDPAPLALRAGGGLLEGNSLDAGSGLRASYVLKMANSEQTPAPYRVRSEIIEVEADARILRESLGRLSDLWRLLEPTTAQRVRFLVTEIVSRSSDPRRHAAGPIRLFLEADPEVVRIEVTGLGLLNPHERGWSTGEGGFPFPVWAIEDLADRWGSSPYHPAAWFEIDRETKPSKPPG